MTPEYLNSFDYIAAYLADTCKEAPGGANHFVLQVELSRPPTLAWFTVHVRQRVSLLPHLTGRMKRKWFTLAPYWKWDSTGKPRLEILQDETCPVSEYINLPLKEGTFFGVLIAGTTLYFKFSHLIFDGIGAERFLRWIFSDAPPPNNPGLLETSHLNDWKKQSDCGRKFRELFLMKKVQPVSALCAEPDSETYLISRTWDAAQIAEEAEQAAGPFMMIPFLIAKCASALEPFLPKEGDIVAPMTVDQRGQEDQPADSILFNHWSLMPLRIPFEARGDFAESVKALKRAFFESTANRVPLLFRHATFWARIVPFFIMRKLEKKHGPQMGGTFMFSYIDNSILVDTYMGQSKVLDVRHYPLMPPRPGIGFIFTKAGNNLHLTVSCRAGILPDEDLLESNLETLFNHGVKDDI